MALHIADSEVSDLVAQLAKLEGANKTETLRRVLRSALDVKKKETAKGDLMDFIGRMKEKTKKRPAKAPSKKEFDEMWGV